jgi:hypothetical protein
MKIFVIMLTANILNKQLWKEDNGWSFSLGLEGEGEVVPVLPLTEHHAMKAYWG